MFDLKASQVIIKPMTTKTKKCEPDLMNKDMQEESARHVKDCCRSAYAPSICWVLVLFVFSFFSIKCMLTFHFTFPKMNKRDVSTLLKTFLTKVRVDESKT